MEEKKFVVQNFIFPNTSTEKWSKNKEILQTLASGSINQFIEFKQQYMEILMYNCELNNKDIKYCQKTLDLLLKEMNTQNETKKFIQEILPFMAKQALLLEDEEFISRNKDIELSYCNKPKSYIFTRKDLIVYLANMFFCTIQPNEIRFFHKDMNVIRFFTLGIIDKIMILLFGYFDQIKDAKGEFLEQHVVFERKVLNKQQKLELGKSLYKQEEQGDTDDDKLLSEVVIENKGIEEVDEDYCVGVDFANKYIGGGSLGWGNVQEEILFAIHPEAYVSQILFQAMKDNESIYFQGLYKYAIHSGYGGSFQFVKPNEIQIVSVEKQVRCIAIDALRFDGGSVPRLSKSDQYQKACIEREVIKSYCGFSVSPYERIYKTEAEMKEEHGPIVTGNWGCGIFQGNVQLKFMIQWISCSLLKRKMVYCPFGNKEIMEKGQLVIKNLRQKNIRDVYSNVLKYGNQSLNKKLPLFDYLLETYK